MTEQKRIRILGLVLAAFFAAQAVALPGAAEEQSASDVPVGAAAAANQDLKIYIDALAACRT